MGQSSGPPERIIPEETHGGALASHLKRYEFATLFCQGKQVLDVACGVGYGSALLSDQAAWVIGVDISIPAIQYALARYQRPKVAFLVGDAHRLPFREKIFDVICSFETIEHLEDPPRFLEEVARLLKMNGVFILSTPQAQRTCYRPKRNPYHVIEFSGRDLERLLSQYFGSVELYGQRRVQSSLHYWLQRLDFLNLRSKLPQGFRSAAARSLVTKPWDEVSTDDIVISKELRGATELIAVCNLPRR